MFVTCNTLWTTLLNKWGMTTQAQKDAFCAIVNGCVPAQVNEVISGLVAPTAPPTNGEKVVVVQGAAGQPNQSYFWTGSQWLLMGDGAGLSGIALGTGGNVTLSGNGTAGSPLVGNVTFPAAPASACDQNKAAPSGVIAEVFGQDAAGGCVREVVVVAPTLCQEIAALPAGAIATVVGRDAAGNCVTGTVSGGGSAATDGSAGIVALNTGNNLPSDATNATDALTASGLAAILQQAGGNALTSAVCAATANCGGGGSSGPCIGVYKFTGGLPNVIEVWAAPNTTATFTLVQQTAPISTTTYAITLDSTGYGSLSYSLASTEWNAELSHPTCYLAPLTKSISFASSDPGGPD